MTPPDATLQRMIWVNCQSSSCRPSTTRIKPPPTLCAALANQSLHLVGWGCGKRGGGGGGGGDWGGAGLVCYSERHTISQSSAYHSRCVHPRPGHHTLFFLPRAKVGSGARSQNTTGPTARLHACACFELVLVNPLGEDSIGNPGKALHVMTCMTRYHWVLTHNS